MVHRDSAAEIKSADPRLDNLSLAILSVERSTSRPAMFGFCIGQCVPKQVASPRVVGNCLGSGGIGHLVSMRVKHPNARSNWGSRSYQPCSTSRKCPAEALATAGKVDVLQVRWESPRAQRKNAIRAVREMQALDWVASR